MIGGVFLIRRYIYDCIIPSVRGWIRLRMEDMGARDEQAVFAGE